MEELESVVGLGQISRPGAWGFPDALEVGVPGAMTWEETKAHVALWAVTSSPLFLANDVREGYMQQRLVDMMTNKAMLAVNQQYSTEHRFAGDRLWSNATGREVWGKPMVDPPGAVGVVLFNRNGTTAKAGCNSRDPSKRVIQTPCDDDPVLVKAYSQEIELPFAALPQAWLGLGDASDQPAATLRCNVSDIFPASATNATGPGHEQDLGAFSEKFTALVSPHGVRFLRVFGCQKQQQ